MSVRHVAALKTFEHAIVRRDRVDAGPPSAEALARRRPAMRARMERPRGAVRRCARSRSPCAEARASPARASPRSSPRSTAALLALQRAGQPPRRDPVGFDGARWLDAVTLALATPVETPDVPGTASRCGARTSRSPCARSRARTRACSPRSRGAAPRPSARLARWRADQFVEISPRQVARANPWAGLPGCVYLVSATATAGLVVGATRRIDGDRCARDELRLPRTGDVAPARIAGEPTHGHRRRRRALEGAAVARRDAAAARAAASAAVADALIPRDRSPRRTAEPDRRSRGSAVDVGYAIDLTIDPDAAGARAAHRRVLHRAATTCAARSGIRAQGGRRSAARRSAARARDGAHGGDRHHRRRERPHRGARRRAVAVHAPGARRSRAARRAATAPAVPDPLPSRRAAESRRLPRRDAGVDDQADHGRGVPVRSRRGRALARRRAGRDRARAAARSRRSRACAAQLAALGFGALPRSHVLRATAASRRCARPWAIQARRERVRLERRMRGARASVAGGATCCSARSARRASTRGTQRVRARGAVRPRCWPSPSAASSAASFRAARPSRARRGQAQPLRRGPRRQAHEPRRLGEVQRRRVVDIVAEGWGQGHARASALGVRGHDGALAAAANGQAAVRRPHLVDAVRGARRPATGARSVRIAPDDVAPREPQRHRRATRPK